jgi:hypothetical protein
MAAELSLLLTDFAVTLDDEFLHFSFIFKEVRGSRTEKGKYESILKFKFIGAFYFIPCCITIMDSDPDPGETNQCGPHQDPDPESRVENLSPAMGRGIDSRNRVWN